MTGIKHTKLRFIVKIHQWKMNIKMNIQNAARREAFGEALPL